MVERVWRNWTLTLLVRVQTGTVTMENTVEIPLKSRNRTAIQPSNPTCVHTHWGNQNWKRHITPVFTAALFTVAKTWKQLRCPLADDWIRKFWYIYTMEYYSAINRNTFESVLMKWMNPEPIIQSAVIQKEKHQYCISMHIYEISEKAMATHSSTLAWKIPWTEEPGRLPSIGSQRVRHNWQASLSLFTFMHWRIGNTLHCSCLENPRNGRSLLAAVYGIAQCRAQLKWLSSSSSIWDLERWWWHSYMQGSKRETDIKNRLLDSWE